MLQHAEAIGIHSVVVVNAQDTPDWAFPLHEHERQLEISLVKEGRGTFYCAGRSYAMGPGDLIVKNAGVVHAEHTSREHPIRQICVSFTGVYPEGGQVNCLLPAYMGPVIRCGEDFALLLAMFDYLARAWQEEQAAECCHHVAAGALELVCQRIEAARRGQERSAAAPKAAQAVAEVVDWIDRNYAGKVTLDRLAEQFFISPFYLEKKFRERTGYSINQYVIERRMGEAQRLLIFEDMRIKEVALAVGYSNLQYFYATFKKYAGKSPRAFRAEYRGIDSEEGRLGPAPEG